jgi:cytochrome P450
MAGEAVVGPGTKSSDIAAVEAEFQSALIDPTHNRDPYPMYRRLREVDPVHRSDLGLWFVTGYHEVQEVLTADSLSKDLRPDGHETADPGPLEQRIAASLFGSEHPRHTRLRSLVSRAFTRRTVAAARESITTTATALLAERRSGEMDLVADFARPLPFLVICDLLGIPGLDRAAVLSWSDAATDAVDPVYGQQPDVQALGNDAAEQFTTYLRPHVEGCRSAASPNLVTALLDARDREDRLSADEVINMVGLLIIAGHETTANQIASACLALLRHPDQLARLRSHRELLPQAVEEALRFDPPVQMERRRPTADTVIGGRAIAEEELVVPCFAAANRDPKVFPDPDRFDIERVATGHVSFGHGRHYCVGAGLARAEIEIALGLLIGLTGLELACDPDEILMRHTVWVRGYERIPVRFSC